MRNLILAALCCLTLGACYREPLPLNTHHPESSMCDLGFADGYNIQRPCESHVIPFDTKVDPGVGAIQCELGNIYFKCGPSLFDGFQDISSSYWMREPYYTLWTRGRIMVTLDNRYGRAHLFYYIIDEHNGMKWEFWSRDLEQEDFWLDCLTSMYKA